MPIYDLIVDIFICNS